MLKTQAPIDYEARLKAFILAADFPCVSAKSAVARGELTCSVYDDISSAAQVLDLRKDVCAFIGLLDRSEVRQFSGRSIDYETLSAL